MPIPRSSSNSGNTPRNPQSHNPEQGIDSLGLPDLSFDDDSQGLPEVDTVLPDFDDPEPVVPVSQPEQPKPTPAPKKDDRPSVHERQKRRQEAQARAEREQRNASEKNHAQKTSRDDYTADFSDDEDHDVTERDERPGKKDLEARKGDSEPTKEVKQNRKDSKGQDVFIDEKSLQLMPFGSTHKSRKAKEHEFDKRANTRRKAVVVRYAALGLLGIMVVLGVKNAVIPPETLNAEEVAAISQQSIGETGFPTERGEAFAKDFMGAYLNTSAQNAESVLSYFYTGEINPDGGSSSLANRNIGAGFNQKIIGGPSVYESVPLTPHSARYTIGALVESSVKKDNLNDDQAELLSSPAPKWAFYNVNVFYDAENDTFQITPESPTVVPSPQVGSRSDLPDPAPLGTGQADDELAADVQSVVYGYLEGYAKSSSVDHSAVDQYVMDKSDITLVNGLDNRYEFANGTAKDSITFEAFSDPEIGGVKVRATVEWKEKSSDITEQITDQNVVNSASSTTTSTYVLTLLPAVSDGEQTTQYLVAKFQPYYFVASEEE